MRTQDHSRHPQKHVVMSNSIRVAGKSMSYPQLIECAQQLLSYAASFPQTPTEFSFFFSLKQTLREEKRFTACAVQLRFNISHISHSSILTTSLNMRSIFGFRKLMKNLFCFGTTGFNEEKAPPPTPVRVDRRLRSSAGWDMEGLRACEELERIPGTHFGIVLRTKSEAAAGKCCIIYPQ